MPAAPPALSLAAILSLPVPACPNARIALVAIRRMGGHGLHDAGAAQQVMAQFGASFRRPLTLLRVLVADLSASASAPLQIAPCCCMRMTAAEGAMVAILARVEREPEAARMLMADLLGTRAVDGPLAIAAAVAGAFADAGRPIG